MILRWPRFRLVGLLVLVAIAAALVARSFLPEPPLIVSYRRKAAEHHSWASRLEKLAERVRDRRMKLVPYNPGPYGPVFMLTPFGQEMERFPVKPEEAEAFDRDRAEDARKLLDLRKYHQEMEAKWDQAARRRLAEDQVPEDTFPPFVLEFAPL